MPTTKLTDSQQQQPTTSADDGSYEEPQAVVKPRSRAFRFSTRGNSDYRWKDSKNGGRIGGAGGGGLVVGALEVQSEPTLNYSSELKKNPVLGREALFDTALKIWKKHDLRNQFIQVCEQIPPSTCLCGLIYNDEDTITEMIPTLNEWARTANEEYYKGSGYKIDCFHWTWNNVSGKARTNILLIRFLEDYGDDHDDNKLKKHSSHKSSSGGTPRSTPRSTPKNSPVPQRSRKRIQS